MVDRQHRPMGKTGSGGLANYDDDLLLKRDQVRKLAMDAIDLSKDPYCLKNHLGLLQCRLCLTKHANEGNYLAHTQGKKHQSNLARRIARESKDAAIVPARKPQTSSKLRGFKIGKPKVVVQKLKDQSGRYKIKIVAQYPQIQQGTQPQYRIINSLQQRVQAFDELNQYLLLAAQPYNTVGIRIPNRELELSTQQTYQSWDREARQYRVNLSFI